MRKGVFLVNDVTPFDDDIRVLFFEITDWLMNYEDRE